MNSRVSAGRQARALVSRTAFKGAATGVALAVISPSAFVTFVQAAEDKTAIGADHTRAVDLRILNQPLQRALLDFSEQAGVQIILPNDMRRTRVRKSLSGSHNLTVALDILTADTGFSYQFTGPNTVIVRRVEGAEVARDGGAVNRIERTTLRRKIRRASVDDVILLEELVTVGTRNPARTVTETAVPVDVIGSASLRRNGYTQTGRLLQALAPSFNFAETTISDGTDIARPATLRGLGPDQVLILVNGKRRHSQAWVNVQNTVGKGSVGTDLNTIPIGAIKRVEILRDGAAAQYGSDAIAGVVNIVLRDEDEGLNGDISWGQTYEGDGDVFQASGTLGLPLGTGGFFTVTAEYQDREATNRADPSSITGDVIMRIGDTAVEAKSVMWNASLPSSDVGELYAFGGLTDRNGLSGGFFRHPFQAARAVPQIYPDGFLPLQRTDVTDFSNALGYRWESEQGWQYDISVVYGRARFAFGAENTVNVSLASAAYYAGGDVAAASPTSGFSGALEFDQLTANFDAAGKAEIFGKPFHMAYGVEYRNETYLIEAGDEASYSCGVVGGQFAPSILDANITAICGFQGFPGYSPDVAGAKGRSSYALYLDSEFEPRDEWFVTAAVRYEDFGETGSRLSGKLSSRFRMSDAFSLRGAISTGFRAPALAQRAFTSVITNTNADGLTQTLVAPEGHPIPRAYGVDQLEHETNTNFSMGMVWKAAHGLTVTLDAYRIDINDRIVLGPTLPIPDQLDLGAIDAGSFFSNAVDTQTHGVDFVACYRIPVGSGRLDLLGSVSWTKTDIVDVNAPEGVSPDVFYPFAERVNVERTQPHTRATVGADYQRGRFGGVVRVNYYSGAESAFYTPAGNNIPEDEAVDVFGLDNALTTRSGSGIIVDIEMSYDLTENFSLAVGANNAFNVFPDELPDNDLTRWISEGRQPGAFGNFRYPWVAMPWGIGGGYYYARMSFDF